jgi:hypothetical protein
MSTDETAIRTNKVHRELWNLASTKRGGWENIIEEAFEMACRRIAELENVRNDVPCGHSVGRNEAEMTTERPIWKVSQAKGIEVARLPDDALIARCCYCDSQWRGHGFAIEMNQKFKEFSRRHDHCGALIHRLEYVSHVGEELGNERKTR